ncbi:YCF48-related protein [Neobacillus mesonae]|nr:YCF48-related protein [Neobacillus mesonae]
MRGTMKWALACVLMLTLTLTACTSSETEEAQPMEVKEEQLEEGQTITLVEPSEYEAAEMNKYQIQTRLTDFQLIHGYGGLAWGVTRNELRLYYTRDNGKTWVNISPSPNVKFATNPVYGEDIFFLDGMHGWIVRSGSDGTDHVVLRTNDGGESWKISSLEETQKVSALYFSSETEGYLMTSTNAGTGKEEKQIFATLDGGMNWKEVMTSSPLQQSDQAISLRGYTEGMHFIDGKKGLVSVLELGAPKIYSTQNGGKSWSINESLFSRSSSLYNACSSYTLGEMESLSLQSQKLWLPLGCAEENGVKYSGLFTKDGGSSWNHVQFNLPSQDGVNKHLYPTFVSETEGWALQGSYVYHTTNQGKDWERLPVSDVLAEKLEDYPEVIKLQFVSPKVGWVLLENASEKKSILMQTIDGGTRWNVL